MNARIAVAVFLLAAPALAQAQRAVVRPELPFRLDPATMVPDKVEVKFVEGIRVRLERGRLVTPGDEDLSPVLRVLGGAGIERLFSRTVEDLDREREALQPRVPAGQPPLADLNNYYLVTTSGAAETARIVDGLNRLPLVETAYPQRIPVPLGDIPPPTPQFVGRQTYLGATAVGGYEYHAIWSVVGARLQTGSMAQLEGSWHFGHEDVDDLVLANVIGTPPSAGWNSWRQHGTACVGIMGAGRNGYGVRGMGSGHKKFYVSSLQNGAANMISLVTAVLQAGDVMSSSFAWALNGGLNHAPVDWQQSTFDAVSRAAAKGIHYTFGAGNTNDDLANVAIFGTRYLPTSPRSGGYIIGATEAGLVQKAGFSSYGSVLAASGWGRRVTTTGYGDLFYPNNDNRQAYTATFGGTSAAGPAVAGVIAAYVGSVLEQNGTQLTPQQVYQDLRSTGTVIPGAAFIGNRPNLLELLKLHGLPDGLLVPQMGSVGGTFQVEVSGNAGEPFAVLVSAGRARVPTAFNRDLLIDLNASFQLLVGVLGAGGVNTVTMPVGGDPALKDANLYLQGGLARAASLHLTNSAELWIQ